MNQMIDLPEFDKAFEYENNFYLSCSTQRISKMIAHYQLFNQTVELAGHIVECGVFKGASLLRWAHFRQMHGGDTSKKIYGFDVFNTFPPTNYEADKTKLDNFLKNAGNKGLTKEQLETLLKHHGVSKGVDLIQGDIVETIPRFVKDNPELKISLLNLDTDIYEPAVTILEHLYDRVVPGGIILLDDYGVFPGETKAVDEFLKDRTIKIRKLPFAKTPSFIIK